MDPKECDAHAEAWEEVARDALARAHEWRESAATERRKRATAQAAEDEAQRKKDLATARRFGDRNAVESTG